MKLLMAIINGAVFGTTVILIVVSLIVAQFGAAWLMVIPALYSGGNLWAILCD